jgi:hypothetical protein
VNPFLNVVDFGGGNQPKPTRPVCENRCDASRKPGRVIADKLLGCPNSGTRSLLGRDTDGLHRRVGAFIGVDVRDEPRIEVGRVPGSFASRPAVAGNDFCAG